MSPQVHPCFLWYLRSPIKALLKFDKDLSFVISLCSYLSFSSLSSDKSFTNLPSTLYLWNFYFFLVLLSCLLFSLSLWFIWTLFVCRLNGIWGGSIDKHMFSCAIFYSFIWYNLYNLQFTHSKCRFQWFIINLQSCSTAPMV